MSSASEWKETMLLGPLAKSKCSICSFSLISDTSAIRGQYSKWIFGAGTWDGVGPTLPLLPLTLYCSNSRISAGKKQSFLVRHMALLTHILSYAHEIFFLGPSRVRQSSVSSRSTCSAQRVPGQEELDSGTPVSVWRRGCSNVRTLSAVTAPHRTHIKAFVIPSGDRQVWSASFSNQTGSSGSVRDWLKK